MTLAALGAIFLVGLFGGMHCAGMCGGIVAALSGGPVGAVALPVRAAGPSADSMRAQAGLPWSSLVALNGGRICIYVCTGALAGWAGSLAVFVEGVLPLQFLMYVAAQCMLIALGLYLLGVPRYIAPLERAGARLWALLRPLAGRFVPVRSTGRAFALGLLWGWIPCGLVYSVLATALLAGDAAGGASVMLAFGLGTLPNLLFAAALMRAVARRGRTAWWRGVSGGLVLTLGLAGLAHAGGVVPDALAGFLCVVPH
ncbi:MAG: sulfite exporter TauE/SafE family protein [Burkholderiales bacterium]